MIKKSILTMVFVLMCSVIASGDISDNPYTTTEKEKLAAITALAEPNPALVSKVDAEAGTSETEYSWSPLRVYESIAAWISANLGTMSTKDDAPSDGTTYGRKDGSWFDAGSGSGDVIGPAGAVAGNLPLLDATGKVLSDSGKKPADFIEAETDPVYGAWDKSTGISIPASQVSDFDVEVANNTAVAANTDKITEQDTGTNTGDNPGYDSYDDIPEAAPSSGDVTHFSFAGSIYTWVIGLGYSTFDGAYSSLTGKPTIPSGNEIIDWTADQGATDINAGNYTDTNTTYTAGDFSHNSLADLNDGTDYEHITQTQKDALNTIIPKATFTQDSGILVGTGAGAFQEETGADLRTSIGCEAALVNSAGLKAAIADEIGTGGKAVFADSFAIGATDNAIIPTKGYVDDNVAGASFWGRDAINGYVYPATLTDKVGIGTDSPSEALDLVGSLELEDTTTPTGGVIYKDGSPFLHNFHHPTGSTVKPDGKNLFIGIGAGNFTMGNTATWNPSASENIGIGQPCLFSNTLGYRNVAVGNYALVYNTTGSGNFAMGYCSLLLNSIGSENTALGAVSLYNNTTGNSNVAIGANALYNLNSGHYNMALGKNAGHNSVSGSNTVFIGYSAQALNNTDTNTIVIGANAVGAGSNTVVLGNNTIVTTVLKGNVGIGTDSPTAVFHLKAGTATASTAPLKLTSGTLLTTPEAGVLEFLTDNLYFTKTTGPTRETIAFETVYESKSADFTAEPNHFYHVDASSGNINITAPASPDNKYAFGINIAYSYGANTVTVLRNSTNIEGDASDMVINIDEWAGWFNYADSTRGWEIVSSN